VSHRRTIIAAAKAGERDPLRLRTAVRSTDIHAAMASPSRSLKRDEICVFLVVHDREWPLSAEKYWPDPADVRVTGCCATIEPATKPAIPVAKQKLVFLYYFFGVN
jgi:hypothetical protein